MANTQDKFTTEKDQKLSIFSFDDKARMEEELTLKLVHSINNRTSEVIESHSDFILR